MIGDRLPMPKLGQVADAFMIDPEEVARKGSVRSWQARRRDPLEDLLDTDVVDGGQPPAPVRACAGPPSRGEREGVDGMHGLGGAVGGEKSGPAPGNIEVGGEPWIATTKADVDPPRGLVSSEGARVVIGRREEA